MHTPSYSVSAPSAITPIYQKMMGSSATSQSLSPASSKIAQRSSFLSLVDQTRMRKVDGDRQSLRGARSRPGSFRNPSSVGHISSEADSIGSGENLKGSSSGSLPNLAESPSPPELNNQPSDMDLLGFIDRFRSRVNQVAQEADDRAEIVLKDSALDGHPPSSYSDPSASQTETLDHPVYDEYGRLGIPDVHVRVLGGYIRRMPTIESLGSRETGSLNPSSCRDTMIMSSSSGHTHVQLLTRSNTSDSTTAPRSRNSSFYAGSEAASGHITGETTSVSYQSAANGSTPLVESSSLAESHIMVEPPK